jgi:hypothetical protein
MTPPARHEREPANLSVNDAPEVNMDLAYGRDERFDGVYGRLHGLSTNYGGGDIGRPASARPAENSVPAGATDFTYTIIVGNRHPRDRDDAPAPNRVVIDLPAGVTAAGLAIDANTCRGVNHGKGEDGVYYEQFCTKRGADEEWTERVEGWKLVISEVDGRQRLDIKNLPGVRWGQRVRYTILTSPVPASSIGSDQLRLDVWVEPARNEPGWCDGPAGCNHNDRRANNYNSLTTRITPPVVVTTVTDAPATGDRDVGSPPPARPTAGSRSRPPIALVSGPEQPATTHREADRPAHRPPATRPIDLTRRDPALATIAVGPGRAPRDGGSPWTGRPPPLASSEGGSRAAEPLEPVPI